MNDSATAAVPTSVECRASKDPAVRLFIGAVALVGFGLYCIYDGYIAKAFDGGSKYPAPEAWDVEHINDVLSYSLNHFGPFVFIPVGLVLAALAFRTLKRFVIANDEGLVVNGRAQVPWSEFTGIDASLLDAKGVLTLQRKGAPGVKLDGYHYRDFRDLVAFIEARVKLAD